MKKPPVEYDSLGRRKRPPLSKASWLTSLQHDKVSVSGKPYDYQKVPDYLRMADKVTFKCPDHGEFTVFAHSHVNHGCRECGVIRMRRTRTGQPSNRKFSLEQFIEKAKAIHPDLDYSKVKGDKLTDVWKLRCPKHSVWYQQKVIRLIYDKSRGCTKCTAESVSRQHKTKSLTGKEACVLAAKALGYKLLKYTKAHEEASFSCKQHGDFKVSRAYYLTQHQSICPACRPASSAPEQLLRQALVDAGLTVEMHRRDILDNGRELDIYLPKHKVAIEVNGVWYHNTFTKSKNYHRDKTAGAEEQGITLLHFTDLDISRRLDLVVSMVGAKCGIFKRRSYARQLELRELSYKRASAFLDKHHMQGSIAGVCYLGLYQYKPKTEKYRLASVAVFGKPRFNKSSDWELLRFATRQGYQVVGGLSKLISHFAQQHSGTLISYANRSYSIGGVYDAIGFIRERITAPSYTWNNGHSQYSRYQTQKHKLADLLDDFDEDLTEHENMQVNGFWPLYNSGNILYSLDLNPWKKINQKSQHSKIK